MIIRNRIDRDLRCPGSPTQRQQKEEQFDSKPLIQRLGQRVFSGDWMDSVSGLSEQYLFWMRDPRSRNCKLLEPIWRKFPLEKKKDYGILLKMNWTFFSLRVFRNLIASKLMLKRGTTSFWRQTSGRRLILGIYQKKKLKIIIYFKVILIRTSLQKFFF